MGAPKQPKRKYRRRSPWGGAFGKPIEDLSCRFTEDRDEALRRQLSQDARGQQYEKMLQLKKRYAIEGDTGWRPWYELALAIASEFDQGFKIVDAPPAKGGKTARKWRGGAFGVQLVTEVEMARNTLGKDVKVLSILRQILASAPKRFGKMTLNHLEKIYYDAVRYIEATKQNKNLP